MGSVCVGAAADTPPNCGRRLIPSTIDHIAEVNPSKVFGSLPVSNTNLEAGFKDLTYGQVANAINGVAWWLEREIGRSHNYETLAYLAPNDFRYPIFAVAAVKAGYTVSFCLLFPLAMLPTGKTVDVVQFTPEQSARTCQSLHIHQVHHAGDSGTCATVCGPFAC